MGLIPWLGRAVLVMVVGLVLLLASTWDSGGFYSTSQARLWNAYQQWGSVFTAHSPYVVVVQIDADSIKALRENDGEDWPWSRQRYAELLQLLFEEYKVAVVGLDMYMPDDRDAKGNTALLDIARRYPVVFSQAFDLENEPANAFLSGQVSAGVAIDNPLADSIFPHARGYIGNTSLLASAPCVGHITSIKNNEGMITQVNPFILWEGRLFPMLALEMLHCYSGADKRYDFTLTEQANGWQIQAHGLLGEGSVTRLVVNDEGQLRIPYLIPKDYIVGIPAIDVLKRQVDPAYVQYLQGGMVLLAGTAPGLGDQQATPLSNNIPGVSVHVQILDWLLSGKDNVPDFSLDVWSWISGFAGLIVLYVMLAFGFRASVVVVVTVLLMVGWLGLGFWVWVDRQWFLPMHPAMLFLFFLVFQIPVEWWISQSAAGRLRHVFRDYLPTSLVDHIVNDSRTDLLQPSRRSLTVLFADIANFTERAEHSAPEEIALLTQQILECLTVVVHKHEGTLDKYMGDAVMVFWNAPFQHDDHADKGVQAALDMLEAIKQFNQSYGIRRLRGKPVLVRIGVHTGDVIVGDLGTRFRHAYTAIGDAVNVAARLQTFAREIEEPLVVSQQTVECLQHEYPLVSRGMMALKGRENRVGIYTLKPGKVTEGG
ncbi:MAG: adenylate/guanylate cyclase domain-containing protein [Thiothrix litoralis]|jgi:adenylate cyclase|nr:adenylate/guanylate cyclase domain-containing protein [Thiothrix litoralis]